MKYELPKLNYGYDALEPYIDAKTMEIHHTKHHQAYTDKMNGVLEKYPELTQSPEELMAMFDSLKMDEADKKVFKNHGGGYINHKLFWQNMDPANQKDQQLVDDLAAAFGSLETFKEKFTAAAVGQFGSGWAWLVRNKEGELEVYGTSNQDSPLLKGHAPILCLDVWEHAYYLKYQNKRPEYIENWWKVVKMI
ncbi:MAG: superoxide dismutase [Candidatus Komeilibacteria bacterium]|nr:superoxide dismutase [Candidatus Komeilibacteria bacterium]